MVAFSLKILKKRAKYLQVLRKVCIFAATNPARFPLEQRTQRDIFCI